MDIIFPKESDVKSGSPFVRVYNNGFELSLMHMPYCWSLLDKYLDCHGAVKYFFDIKKFLYTGVTIKVIGKEVAVYVETDKDTPAVYLADYDGADKADFRLILDNFADILQNELEIRESKEISDFVKGI